MELSLDFLDPLARQQRKLEALRGRCPDLRAARFEAVAVGDDDATAKAWAALHRAEGELRAVAAAVAELADRTASAGPGCSSASSISTCSTAGTAAAGN